MRLAGSDFGRRFIECRVMVRPAPEIAARAIICGALGFRASLEVTDHPRARELSSRLLPWLAEQGLAYQIEPFHREILEAECGQLPPSHRTEAYWRGESAALLGWTIHLFDIPDRILPVDPGELVSRLHLLEPEARILLATATLQPKQEIEEFCAFCLAVRTRFQQLSASPDVAPILDRILRTRLTELGLHDADAAIAEATAFAAQTTPPPRGLYVIRAIAAEWLLEPDGESSREPDVAL